MTSSAEVKKQIQRLMRLPFAPADERDSAALAREFERILKANCKSDRHLAAVADYLVDTSAKVPAPADLVTATRDVLAPEIGAAPMGCEVCCGSGWKQFEKWVDTPAGRYQADYADFCDCARGKWMRDADRTRREEERSKQLRKAGLA